LTDDCFEHRKKKDRREYLPASLMRDREGRLSAVKFHREGSGILSFLVGAEGLVNCRKH
jgi:molybdopterin molybdotransferase